MPDNPMPPTTVKTRLSRTWDEIFWRLDNAVDAHTIAAFLLGVLIGTWIA